MFSKVSGSAGAGDDDCIGIGDKGITVTMLSPSGSAQFGNGVYEVTALEGRIAQNRDVEVVLIENNRIFVRPAGSRS